jgi:alcohol dehydrogenase
MTARLFSPTRIIVSDFDDRRLVIAQASGATHVINHRDAEAATRILALTGFDGVDTAIEAIGSAYSHALCEKILAPGGRIAKIGTHGTPASRHFEKSWDRNISITTRLVDTASTQMLMRKLRARKLDPIRLITHRFNFNHVVEAYETFEAASSTGALKVLLET